MGYKKRPSAGWAALWQNLQLDLEIGLDLLGGLDGILQHGVELVVVGLQQQLLGHEADAGILDAGQCLDGGLNFGGAVRAVDFDLEFLLQGGSLLYI